MPVLNTLFPPVPQTVWPIYDAAITRQLGDAEGMAWRVRANAQGLVTCGPHLALETGLYGVEFQMAMGDGLIDPATPVAVVQVTENNGARALADATITAGEIGQPFAGMYGGARITMVLDRPARDVEFRVYSLGKAPFYVTGFKLIPRPGRIWFPADLPRVEERWTYHADQSATCVEATMLGGPEVSLAPGDYRVGVKLMPPANMKTGEIVALDVIAQTGEGEIVLVPETRVTAEEVLVNFAVPDTKLRFRLTEPLHGVEVRVWTLVEGVTIQWMRIATADEAVWHHYYNMGGLSSPLGHPISTFLPSPASPKGLSGFVRYFERGAIYWTVEHGPCEVFGEAFTRLYNAGGTGGALGFPTSRPHQSDTQLTQTFEGDTLSWVAQS